MFRIVCLVEDKKLAPALNALAGLVLNMEPPQPVTNAVVKKGKVTQASSATSIVGQIEEWITSCGKGALITREAIITKTVSLGGSAKSVGSMVTGILERKVMKRKSPGTYVVS